MFSPISNQSPIPESVGESCSRDPSPIAGVRRLENPRGICFAVPVLPPGASRQTVHSKSLRQGLLAGTSRDVGECAKSLLNQPEQKPYDESETLSYPSKPPTSSDLGRSFLERNF